MIRKKDNVPIHRRSITTNVKFISFFSSYIEFRYSFYVIILYNIEFRHSDKIIIHLIYSVLINCIVGENKISHTFRADKKKLDSNYFFHVLNSLGD